MKLIKGVEKMCRILISINPCYVDRILNGKKKFEFRKRVGNRKITSLVIYCTFPVMKIVGEVEVKSILTLTPKDLWETTKEFSGVEKTFYDKYFYNKSIAYAYELGIVRKYIEPLDLFEFGVRVAPQSFIYLKN